MFQRLRGKNKEKDKAQYEDLVKDVDEEDYKVVNRNWAVQAVEHFFKYNINPNFIRSRRERAKAEAKKEAHSTNWGKWAMIFIMVIIGASVAYYIFSTGGGSAGGSVAKAGGQVIQGTQLG